MKIESLFLGILLACVSVQATSVTAPVAEQPQASHPFFRTEDYPAWSRMTPEQAVTDARAAIAEARQRTAAILALPATEYNFENTFLACYEADENLRQVQGYLYHLSNAMAGPGMQQALNIVLQETTAFEGARADAAQLLTILETAAASPSLQQLSPAKKRFVEHILADLKTGGAGLSAEERARKAAIETELKQLSMAFSINVQMGPRRWQLLITDPSELRGMPRHWMQRAAAAALATGKATEQQPAWLITPNTAPEVLRLCAVAETRRKCWYGTQAAGSVHGLADNEPIIARTMELRHELATLLGYENFADMQAARRMMGSGRKALEFIDNMLTAAKPVWDAYVAEKLARHSRLYGSPVTHIAPWDEEFVDAQLPPRPGKFNYGSLTPYLPADRVIPGLMNLWAGMLNLRFEEHATACLHPGTTLPPNHVEVWHPGVRFFSVHDAGSGTHLGDFYLDLYPRQAKRSQAWCMPLSFGDPGKPHLAVLMANLTPPPAKAGSPHLFTHADLYTLAHEFGHLMHLMLSHGELRAQNAMSVERDFVEMPSHLMESWVWEPEALATFARHFETGEPLPHHLAEMLARDRKGNSPILPHMRMLCASKMDLELNMHWHSKFKGRSLDEAAAEILAPWQMPYTITTPSDMRTMTHCISDGYAASLYTYKWSEALAADAFTRFRKEGVLNPKTGADLRRSILSKGGSKPATELFHDFMGRAPQPDALMHHYRKPDIPGL